MPHPRPCLCGTLRRTARLMTQVYDDLLKPAGLKVTQFSMLRAIQSHGPLSVSNLAESLLLDRTSCTRNLELLAGRGIVRFEQGDDKRVKLVHLSEQGQKVLAQATPLWEQAQDHVYTRFGPEVVEHLVQELVAITSDLKKPQKKADPQATLPS